MTSNQIDTIVQKVCEGIVKEKSWTDFKRIFRQNPKEARLWIRVNINGWLGEYVFAGGGGVIINYKEDLEIFFVEFQKKVRARATKR